MLEVANFFLGGILGTFLGIWGTIIRVRFKGDNDTREAMIKNVNETVHSIQNYYLQSDKITHRALMDYNLKSVVGDVRLKPILGTSIFENEYYETMIKLFNHTMVEPSSISDGSMTEHIDSINQTAADLKRIIQIDSDKFRFWPKR